MGKPRAYTSEKFNKVIKRNTKSLPFKYEVERPIRLCDTRERQLMTVLRGLSFLKAPAVPCQQFSLGSRYRILGV